MAGVDCNGHHAMPKDRSAGSTFRVVEGQREVHHGTSTLSRLGLRDCVISSRQARLHGFYFFGYGLLSHGAAEN
jgi:hypothetical protein